MAFNDTEFFHRATKRICGSLDINTIMKSCLAFFKDFMPLEGLAMKIYDPETRSIVNIATAGLSGRKSFKGSIPLPEEAAQFIEEQKGPSAEIVNRPENHFLIRLVWKAMGKKNSSIMILKLAMDGEKIGVVLFMARGFDRYTRDHANLLELVHDPFAIALANTLKHQQVLRLKELLADNNQYLSRQLHHVSGDEIVGREFGLKYVMDMVRQIAPQKSQVLLLGETGVGKEVIANAIHYSSPRAKQPFIKVNCGAIPENLIDSELFGHEKGAFTGALARKKGRFERADKGTLFLDEIGELPPQIQVRLLRVLQNKEIERVGGTSPLPVNIRIIAATHRDLPKMVSQGKFREDLWFRLNVFPITIPPLRQRKSDIPALTRYFMEKKAREMNFHAQPVLAHGALERLQAYHWPGNVRELENLVERTIILNMTGSPEKPLKFETLVPEVYKIKEQVSPDISEAFLSLEEVTKNHIQKALEMTGGKVQGAKSASTLLDIHPNTLRSRMKKLGIPYGRKDKSYT